jgi:ATP-dependent DNA helicase RecG
MAATLDDLKQWMDTPREGANLEFKEAKNLFDIIKVYRYCVALANEGGGRLVLGVSDKPPRRIVNSQAYPNVDDVASKIFNKLRFRVDVEELQHPDGRVVIFHIPSRPNGTAYHYEGMYLMRSTEDCVAMSEDRLRQIFNEGGLDWIDISACDDCSGDDAIRLLSTECYFDLLGLPYPSLRSEVLERFEREKLIRRSGSNWTITNMAAILFAKSLDDFPELKLRGPRVIAYEGTNKLRTRIDKPATKGYALGFEGLLEYIDGLIPQNEVVGKALRRSVKMFPAIAIRELVANALIHQDFREVGNTVMIEIYSDRIEIRNPGKPFISLDRFIDEAQSRNERLADLMRRLHICERQGSGIDKVIQAAEILQLPAPDFRVGERSTTAVLFAHKPFERMAGDDRIRACWQHCVLRYVMGEQMTNQSLRDRFKLPSSKKALVSQIIAATVKAGKIKTADPAQASKRYAKYIPIWA